MILEFGDGVGGGILEEVMDALEGSSSGGALAEGQLAEGGGHGGVDGAGVVEEDTWP